MDRAIGGALSVLNIYGSRHKRHVIGSQNRGVAPSDCLARTSRLINRVVGVSRLVLRIYGLRHRRNSLGPQHLWITP